MSTKIEWTEKTWNPVVGCSKVSPGCEHCYAQAWDRRFRGPDWKPWTAPNAAHNVRLHNERLFEPLTRRKPTMWFVNSMSDLFHPLVPYEFRYRIFAVMLLAGERGHIFQGLTKRPEEAREFLSRHDTPLGILQAIHGLAEKMADKPIGEWWPLRNYWHGVSAEDDRRLRERAPIILDTPAAVRFLSLEPLLSDLPSLPGFLHDSDCSALPEQAGPEWLCICNEPREDHIDWCIVGGESGPGARPCDLEWVRRVVNVCQAASVPVFVKQLGSVWAREYNRASRDACPPYSYYTVSDAKGGTPDLWPEDLRVREWPR